MEKGKEKGEWLWILGSRNICSGLEAAKRSNFSRVDAKSREDIQGNFVGQGAWKVTMTSHRCTLTGSEPSSPSDVILMTVETLFEDAAWRNLALGG